MSSIRMRAIRDFESKFNWYYDGPNPIQRSIPEPRFDGYRMGFKLELEPWAELDEYLFDVMYVKLLQVKPGADSW